MTGRRDWVASGVLAMLSCVHSPRVPVTGEDIEAETVQRERLRTRAALERVPPCLPGEWENAQPVSVVMDGGLGTGVAVRGVFQPGEGHCNAAACLEPDDTRSRRAVQVALDGRCCNACLRELVLVDGAAEENLSAAAEAILVSRFSRRADQRPLIGVAGLDHGLPEEVIDCASTTVASDLVGAPIVAWLTPSKRGRRFEVDRLCHGPLAPLNSPSLEGRAPEFRDLAEGLWTVGTELGASRRGDLALYLSIRQLELAHRLREALDRADQFRSERPHSALGSSVEHERVFVLRKLGEHARAALAAEAAARAFPEESESFLAEARGLRGLLSADGGASPR